MTTNLSLTTTAAAQKLDCTLPSIGKLIETGTLQAVKVGGEWQINRESFNHLLRARRRAAEAERKENLRRREALLENQKRAQADAERIQRELYGDISNLTYKIVGFAAAVRRARSDLFEDQEARP